MLNRTWLKDVESTRILIRSFWNSEHFNIQCGQKTMCSKSELKKSFSFFTKTAFFYTPKWNFFIRVDTLFSCASLSTVSNYSIPKHKRISYMCKFTRLAFFDFDRSSRNTKVLTLCCAAIFVYQIGSIVQTPYNYIIFFLFVLIFYEKLQVEVGYRFFFCLVY